MQKSTSFHTSISMEDFLTGKPNFKFVYQKQYTEGEYPYEEN